MSVSALHPVPLQHLEVLPMMEMPPHLVIPNKGEVALVVSGGQEEGEVVLEGGVQVSHHITTASRLPTCTLHIHGHQIINRCINLYILQ